MKVPSERRILIYRLGSLGDTLVALPALRLVERAFPDAERWMLTNFSVNSKAAPMARILEGTGLVHGYIEYPLGLRYPAALLSLRRAIRRLKPEALVYLAPPRGRLKALRDAAFFQACGIRHIIGVPYSKSSQRPLKLADGDYEYEGARLLRCIASLGRSSLDDSTAFDVGLNDFERATAHELLSPMEGKDPLIAASIGAKDDVKDWGDANWSGLLSRIGNLFPNAGLVMLGVDVEQERSEALMKHWPGDSLNLCGRLTVRESAAVLERADFFIGHDSGPLHLAATVGTPCVAIFSSRNLPGEWFPYGPAHKILYRPIDCQGCRLDVCVARAKACISSISVEEVLGAVEGIFDV